MESSSFPVGTRVRVPGGRVGKVIRVSERLKYSHLVQFDAGGGAWSFRPGELTKVEQQSMTRPWP